MYSLLVSVFDRVCEIIKLGVNVGKSKVMKCLSIDFSIYLRCTENRPLSQRTQTPYKIKVN